MSHFDTNTRRKLITQMSGEYIRAALASPNVESEHYIKSPGSRQDLARGSVALAKEHVNALEAAFKEPGSASH